MNAPEELEKNRRLIALCAMGDEESWERLLNEYGVLIYRIIGRYRRNQQEMRELFIHVVENLWSDGARRLRAWEGRSGFATYLSAVTSRLCIDYFRGRMHLERTRYEPLDRHEPQVSRTDAYRGGGAGAPRHVAQRECCNVLMDCIGRLSEDERAVVTLFYWQGRRYAEIASIIGIPAGVVGKRLISARGKIRRMLVRSGIKKIADLLE